MIKLYVFIAKLYRNTAAAALYFIILLYYCGIKAKSADSDGQLSVRLVGDPVVTASWDPSAFMV